jgi:F-type H+/Na+-transporting ATPase subunit alpha
VALTGGLFDSVPLDQMRDAERALRAAAPMIPIATLQRLNSTDKLSAADREMILVARGALVPFQTSHE